MSQIKKIKLTEKIILDELENNIPLSEIARKYGYSRATAWLLIKDNPIYQKNHKFTTRKSGTIKALIYPLFLMDYKHLEKLGLQKQAIRAVLRDKYKITNVLYKDMKNDILNEVRDRIKKDNFDKASFLDY